MSEFYKFKRSVAEQIDKMISDDLFVVDIEKDLLWEAYLNSFPPGTNEIFRERRAYDCQSCKQFIRACGNVVAIIDNKLVSIWDVKTEGYYQTVADSMAALVKSKPIKNIFRSQEQNLGTDFNHQKTEDGTIIKWEHFFYKLPQRFVDMFPGPLLSEAPLCQCK